VKDQPSVPEDERWWALGLSPRPGGNPPEIPPDYLYEPESNLYWSPRNPGFIPPRTSPPIIDRRVLPSGEIKEWERPRSIPDDFIYDPEVDGYYPAGEASDFDPVASLAEFEEARRRGEFTGGLITNEQLIASGAIDPTKSRRKPLRGKASRTDKRQLDLFGDDDDASGEEEASDDDDAE